MNKVALGEAATATMRYMAHACQQFNALCVITVSECEQCLAERQQQRILGIRQNTTRLHMRHRIEDSLYRRSTAGSGERHHRVRDIEGPRGGEVLSLPAIGQ